MPETKLSELGGFSRFLKTESNAQRLNRVIHIFREKHPDENLTAILEDLIDGKILERVLKDSNFWFPFNIEVSILEKLSKYLNIQEIFFEIGKEFFMKDVFEILPSDNIQINLYELISRLPLFIDRYIRYFEVDLIEIKKRNLVVKIVFDDNHFETEHDLFFLRGMLEGTALLFQAREFKVIIKKTSLDNVFRNEEFIIDTNTIFNSKESLYDISWEETKVDVGKTNFSQIFPKLETKTFTISNHIKGSERNVAYVDISDVLNRSKELYIENRDLEAAVEVLKSLRNELIVKQKSITKDLKIARNIQRGIIPQKIPDWQGLQFAVSFIPMQEVSGDYYDYFNFGSNRLGILVSDVSGHGVPAAFITAISKLLFTNYKLDSPSEIFGNANAELLDLVKQLGYLTCFYGIVNLDYEITYSIAGHPRPILYRYKSKEIVILEGEGTFLGMFEDAREHFKDYKIKLEPGDKLFIFTDGLVEGMSDSGEQFQTESLIKYILETDGMEVKASLDHVMLNFHKFCRGTDQGDDITLLCVGLSLNMTEFEKFKHDAEKAFAEGSFEVAAENLLKANKILPNDLNVLLILGKCYAKIRNYNESIKYLEEYNSLKTYNADSHLILGYSYYKLQNYGRAESELQKSISLRNGNIPAFLYLTRTLIRQNSFEKANAIVIKTLNIDPNNRIAQMFKEYLKRKLK